MAEPAATQTTTVAVQPADYGPTGIAKGMGEWAALLVGVALLAGMIARWINQAVKRDIHDTDKRIGDVKHRTNNELAKQDSRITSLEHGRVEDVARIVRLETQLAAIERGQVSIEHSIDRAREDAKTGREEIVAAIRRLQDDVHRRD